MPRELIETGKDKRFVRRDPQGRFKNVVDAGQSLASDRRRKAKRTVTAGEGDRGDQKLRSGGRSPSNLVRNSARAGEPARKAADRSPA